MALRLVGRDLFKPDASTDVYLYDGSRMIPSMHATLDKFEARPAAGVTVRRTPDPATLVRLVGHPEPRYGKVDLEAEVRVEGKAQTARGSVRFRVANPSHHLHLADGIPVVSIPWGVDPEGRRAARLIVDAIHQLPPEFLAKLQFNVGIVRTSVIDHFASGVAPPLLHRTVFISDRSVRALKPGTTIGKPDTDFVRMFVHELAHIALYEQCGGVDVVRSLFEAGIAGLPAVGVPTLVAWLAALVAHHGMWSSEDHVSEWCKAAGWVVNDRNPFAWAWSGGRSTSLPNIVTGFWFFGKLAPLGLRCTDAGNVARPYGLTDAHEDFATTLEALAVTSPGKRSSYGKRRHFIESHCYWPKGTPNVRAGGHLVSWSKANKPEAIIDDWVVDLGVFARPGGGRPTRLPKRVTGTGVHAASITPGIESDEPTTGDPGDVDGTAEGEGYEWTLADEVADEGRIAGRAAAAVATVTQAQAHIAELGRPTTSALAGYDGVPERVVDLAAELYTRGGGLISVDHAKSQVVAHGARTGDLLLASDGSLWAIRTVDDARVVEAGLVGRTVDPDADRPPRPVSWPPRAGTVRLRWRPSDKPRLLSDRDDVDAGLRRLVGLWGARSGTGDRDLATAGGVVAEVADAAGVPPRDLDGLGDAATRTWCDDHGGLVAGTLTTPAVGDVVRLRRARWGAVVARHSGALDVLVQAGSRPTLDEATDEVTLLFGIDPAEVSGVWAPPW